MSDYEATLDAIKHVRAPLKLVVAGNHDLTLDEEWMTTHEGDYRIRHLMDEHEGYKDSREFWTSPEGRARKEGVTFLDEGVHSFKLTNGAKLTVSLCVFFHYFIKHMYTFPFYCYGKRNNVSYLGENRWSGNIRQ